MSDLALLEDCVRELRRLLDPMRSAATDPDGLYILLSECRWSLDELLGSDLAPLRQGIETAEAAFVEAIAACDAPTTDAALLALSPALRHALDAIEQLHHGLTESGGIALDPDAAAALGKDIAECLALKYLARGAPTVLAVARMVGLVSADRPARVLSTAAGGGRILRFPVARPTLRYDRLTSLRSDALIHMVQRLEMARAPAGGGAAFLGPGSDPLRLALNRLKTVAGPDALKGIRLTIDVSGITVSGSSVPLADGGPIAIPFPIDDPPTVTVAGGNVTLTWAPAALPPGADVTLFEEHGFAVAIPGAGSAGCPTRGLTLFEQAGALGLKLQGGLSLVLPLAAITGENGDSVKGLACATLEIMDGGDPTLKLDALTIGPARFHIGGPGGVLIEDATVTVEALAFSTAAFDASALKVSAGGMLSVGNGAVKASATAAYDAAARAFTLKCMGSLQLGDAIVIEPIDNDTPIFELDAHEHDQTVAVSGRLRLPRGNGLEAVALSGTIGVATLTGAAPRITSFTARSDAQARWELPGGVTLTQAVAAIAYDGTRFAATLEGAVEIAAAGAVGAAHGALTVTVKPGDPTDVRLDGTVDQARLNFENQAAVLDGTLTVAVRTKPAPGEPGVVLGLTNASAGLFAADGVATPTTADDFMVAVEGLAGILTASPASVALTVTAGELWLPRQFSDDPTAPAGERPRVDLATADLPLTLTLASPSNVTFAGRLTLHDVGVRVPLDAHRAFIGHLDGATLDFSSTGLPRLSQVSGRIEIPMPDEQIAEIDFTDIDWDLRGLPTGTLSLGQDLKVDLGGDFTLTLLHQAPAGLTLAEATGLTVTRQPRAGGPDVTTFRFYAAVRFTFPEAVLTDAAGATVWAQAAGSITLASDGNLPAADITALSLGGDFRLGGHPDGLLLTGARLDVTGISNVFNRSLNELHTLVVGLSGAIQFPDQGPRLELDQARFVFTSNDLRQRPEFNFAGLKFSPGERLVQSLPIKITTASLTLKHHDADLTLAQLFEIDAQGNSNIVIGLGAALEIPMGDVGTMARVDNIEATLERGIPKVSIGGIGFMIDNLTISSMTLDGGVYLGGLEHLFQIPPDPSSVFGAGKLGGSMNGMGITALVAFKLNPPMPLGVCIGLEAGSAGIPLAQTGILLTGASGGISFANSNASPCDMSTYIRLGDDGRPKPLPTDAAGRPMKFPPADTQAVHVREKPDKPLSAPGCPCECPPPTMNVFCQPHPDQEQFPGRAILKFSSLTQDFIEALLVPAPDAAGNVTLRPLKMWVDGLHVPAGVTALEQFGVQLGTTLVDAIRDEAFRLWPGGAAEVPADVQHLLETTKAQVVARVTEALHNIGPRSLWQLVCDEAYKGLPCPDVTEQITATFSYSGVSSFLSVTGGVNVSSTGAAGIIGWVNLVGIRVGRLRGFIAATSRVGEIDPSICGQILLAVGPFEFGEVNATINCEGFLSGLRNAVVVSAAQLGTPLVRRVIAATSESLAAAPEFTTNPESLLEMMTVPQLTAYAGEVTRLFQRETLPPGDAARVRDCVLSLAQTIYDAFNPQMVFCGQAGISVFGFKLGSDLVNVNAWVNKTGMGASVAFSPICLFLGAFNAVTATIGALLSGFEEALLGFTCDFPDPVQLILDGLGGAFKTPAELEAFLEQGVEALLRNSNFVVMYRMSPFGMRLVDTAARTVLPDFVNHPARPGRTPWVRPPDRLELLQNILAQSKLADAYWNGRLSDIAPDYGDQWLNTDYFPHGGIIGAAKMVLPKAILESPPLETFKLILEDGALMPRLQAAMGYVKDYLLSTEDVGTMGFYAPAPNPPGFTYNGRALSREELLRCFTDRDFAADVLAHTASINPDTSAEAFFLGVIHGRLLGLPVLEAKAEFVPAGRDGPMSEGHILIEAETPAGSWPRKLGLTASVMFKIRQSPPLPMDVAFETFARALGVPIDPATTLAADAAESVLARLPRTPSQLAALMADVRAGILASSHELAERMEVAQLPADYPNRDVAVAAKQAEREARLEPHLAKLGDWVKEWTDRVNAQVTGGMSPDAQAGAIAQALLGEVMNLLAKNLPKVAFEADFRFVVPSSVSGLIGTTGSAMASLVGYSPGYDPAATGGVRASARRTGGIVLEAALHYGTRFGGASLSADIDGEFTILPGSQDAPPRLAGMFEVADVKFQVWGAKARLGNVRASLDSAPAGTDPLLSIQGDLPSLQLGKFGFVALDGGQLAAGFETRRTGNSFTTVLRVPPVRLTLPLLESATTLLVHGDQETDPFKVASDGSFDAGLTLSTNLRIQSPFDPADPALLEIGADEVAVSLSRSTTGVAHLRLSVPPTTDIVVFPGQPFEQRLGGQGLEVDALSTGRVDLHLTLTPLKLGGFQISGVTPADNRHAPLAVRLTQYGFSVAGARLWIGESDGAIRIRQFVVNGNGEVRVSATAHTLKFRPFFDFKAGNIHFAHTSGQAHLNLKSPKLELFPGGVLKAEVPLPSDIEIDSSGAFEIRVDRMRRGGIPSLAAKDLLELSGSLTVGYAPPSTGGAGLYVRMSDATLKVRLLPGAPTFHASRVELTPHSVEADVQAEAFGVPGLLMIGQSGWQMHMGLTPPSMALEAAAPSIRLFDMFEVGGATASLSVSARGATTVHVGQVEVVPGLLTLKAGDWTLNNGTVGFSGAARILGHDLPAIDLQFTRMPDGIKATLSEALSLLSIPGLANASVPTNSLLLKRGPGGNAFTLGADLQVSLFGATVNAQGTVATDGTVRGAWSNGEFVLGPFRLKTHGASHIEFNAFRPLTSRFLISLAEGALFVNRGSRVSGWPSAGVSTGAFSLSADGNFSFTLPGFAFGGIDLVSDANNSITLSRADGTIALDVSNSVKFMGVNTALALHIDSTGAVSGGMSVTVSVHFASGQVDFADVHLDLNRDDGYLFSAVATIGLPPFEVTYWLGWKPAAHARVGKYNGRDARNRPRLSPCVEMDG